MMNMSKKILFTVYIMAFSLGAFAQNKKKPGKQIHQIVFQMSNDDTLVHKGLMRQLNNVLSAAPDAKIEVVCHGPGIEMIMTGKTVVLDKIQVLKSKGVVFAACENTLKEKHIDKKMILTEAGFVPSALIEIVVRQEEGWSYIKAGF